VRFVPVPAAKTESCLRDLVGRYQAAQQDDRHHPVLLVGLMILDLLVVHPFADGNGRVARVLTNALLVDAGYEVCRWVSLEQLIAESADEYYEALLRSTHDWHEDSADPWPWLTYFVTTLAAAYRRFGQRAAADRSSGTKQDRVRAYVLNHADLVFKLSQVREALPGVSDPTIRLVLEQLKNEGRVRSSGTGRGAVWVRLPDPV
jgi:Fic family protein